MRQENYQVLGESETPERGVGVVDQQVLIARQIRLYIENAPVFYPLAVATAFVVAAVLIWPFAPDDHPKVVLWTGFVVATLLIRLLSWAAYSAAQPDDDAVRSWLKWFLAPQLCSVMMIGAGPFLFLPASSGHDYEILIIVSMAVYISTFGSSLKLSGYRPAIAIVLTPMVAIYAAGTFRLPGVVPKLLALGGILCGLFGYLLARRVNQAFVRSMELSIRNEQLVNALESRTAQLQQQRQAAEEARQAAEDAERDKTRFLAAASHDLRQPMHAISLLVGMLQRRSSSVEREVMERLEQSVEAMDSLFSTILDLSKLDSGAVRPSIEEIPLRGILDSIEIYFAPQAASKRLTLSVFPSRAVVRTDRALLGRVLRNLVSNAIKYTPTGHVLVGCRRRGEDLLIGVWDTGVGIAREDLGRIFEEFFQAREGPRERDQGLGLGLSIVQRLARLLGSRVEVVSIPGRGSWFGLKVPFVAYLPTVEQRATRHPTAGPLLVDKFVLVVDDDPHVRYGTEALLRQWGCYTASAASVEAVQAILGRELRFPDAIVTDYSLGAGQTGLDVIATVRKYTGEQTPVVIVTGDEGVDAATLLYAALKKPVSAEQLRKCLVTVLGLSCEAPVTDGSAQEESHNPVKG